MGHRPSTRKGLYDAQNSEARRQRANHEGFEGEDGAKVARQTQEPRTPRRPAPRNRSVLFGHAGRTAYGQQRILFVERRRSKEEVQKAVDETFHQREAWPYRQSREGLPPQHRPANCRRSFLQQESPRWFQASFGQTQGTQRRFVIEVLHAQAQAGPLAPQVRQLQTRGQVRQRLRRDHQVPGVRSQKGQAKEGTQVPRQALVAFLHSGARDFPLAAT